MKRTIVTLLAGAALVVSSAVQAAVVCGSPFLHTDDVTFGGVEATDCTDQTLGTATAAALGSTGLTGFTGLSGSVDPGKSATGELSGASFTFGVTGSGDRGDWSLAWSGVNGPVTIDLVAVVQSTTSFAAYFFDDLILASTPGAGTWLINFLGLEDTATMALFARDLRTPGTTPPPTADVSEPGTLLLIALTTLGLACVPRLPRRARRR